MSGNSNGADSRDRERIESDEKSRAAWERLQAEKAAKEVRLIDTKQALRDCLSGGNHGTIVVAADGQGLKDKTVEPGQPPNYEPPPIEMTAYERMRAAKEQERRMIAGGEWQRRD